MCSRFPAPGRGPLTEEDCLMSLLTQPDLKLLQLMPENVEYDVSKINTTHNPINPSID
jgi:hypothetical protein